MLFALSRHLNSHGFTLVDKVSYPEYDQDKPFRNQPLDYEEIYQREGLRCMVRLIMASVKDHHLYAEDFAARICLDLVNPINHDRLVAMKVMPITADLEKDEFNAKSFTLSSSHKSHDLIVSPSRFLGVLGLSEAGYFYGAEIMPRTDTPTLSDFLPPTPPQF